MARPNRSREKVLEAAAALAAHRGVTATTVDDIAERAGVAKGSVYYCFASKDAVFEAVLADAAERMRERLAHALAAADAGTSVAAVVRAFLEGVEERPAVAKVVAGELFRTDRPWQESLADYRASLFAAVADAIAADGRARPTTLGAAAVVGAMVMVAFERTVFAPEASIPQAVRAVLAGSDARISDPG